MLAWIAILMIAAASITLASLPGDLGRTPCLNFAFPSALDLPVPLPHPQEPWRYSFPCGLAKMSKSLCTPAERRAFARRFRKDIQVQNFLVDLHQLRGKTVAFMFRLDHVASANLDVFEAVKPECICYCRNCHTVTARNKNPCIGDRPPVAGQHASGDRDGGRRRHCDSHWPRG